MKYNEYTLKDVRKIVSDSDKISPEVRSYLLSCIDKSEGKFDGDVLTPSQLNQIGNYAWSVIPIG